jgi:hypothetical protein
MQGLTQEQLAEIAEALNTLAKYGLLYGGFRKRQRRVVEVRATKYLVVKYEDGELRYLSPMSIKTHHFYIHLPPPN